MSTMRIANLPAQKLAYSNRVYVCKSDFEAFSKKSIESGVVNLEVGPFVFLASPYHELLSEGEIGLNGLQRKSGSFTLGQEVRVNVFIPSSDVALTGITIIVDLLVKKTGSPKSVISAEELTKSFKELFCNQVFCTKQQLAMDFNGIKLDLIIDAFEHAETGLSDNHQSMKSSRGQVLQGTIMNYKNGPNVTITGENGPARNESLFRSDFNFQSMGIGGLGDQFQTMFRRAFASRIFPGLVRQLGINHVRGILLYGPPGCGKTLIARQIGKVLNAREPKIVNGPEVLDKFVGGTEEKIRELFADAEKEQAEVGDASMLHIIIFDEMDAIMKARGSTKDSTGVSDSMVNQLLAKIDGVDSLNNILIIGMTNRKDMIDEAILRPGRLEVHIEISLPDERGRQQILDIHTLKMRNNKRISDESLENLPELARETKNFTGAELEGLVRNAVSYAFARNIDGANISAVDEKAVIVEWQDFTKALKESNPAFGNKDNENIQTYYRNGIINYGFEFDSLHSKLLTLINQTRTNVRTPLMSVLLDGPPSTGKTAIASKLSIESDFPFIRMITADSMIGYSESQKCAALLRIFSDSYKSPLSIILIDDIERIIEYSPIGPRFSNTVLQTLLILIRKIPPEHSRLIILATTSISHLLDDLMLTTAFDIQLTVPRLETQDEIKAALRECHNTVGASINEIAASITKPIGIKKLLLVVEMARQDNDLVSYESFVQCLHTIGY